MSHSLRLALILGASLLSLNGWALESESHPWLDLDSNGLIRQAGRHAVWGTQVSVDVQPLPSHRLRWGYSIFTNDHGPATEHNESFGGCLSACETTGGNRFYKYQDHTLLYQYRLPTPTNTHSEIWMGVGPSETKRTVSRYQLNNGDATDRVATSKEHGVAWEIDFVARYKLLYVQSGLSGSTSSESYGLFVGLGVGI